MSCANPIDVALLFDYWIEKIEAAEEETVEEHLFGCDRCGERLQEAIALAEGVRKVAMQGDLQTVVSEAFVRRAAEVGLRVREYKVPAGGSVQCTVTEQDDLLIGRLEADLRDVTQIDLSVCDPAGVEMRRVLDIPFDRETGSVLWQQSITFAKGAPSGMMMARLVAMEDGGERLLGEYTFHHTRTIPGPAAW
jgi:hypothetical protein